MQMALDHFRANIDRVRHLSAIFQNLQNSTTGIIDLSDILRAEIVLAVSALDYFIHEIVRFGILEIYNGVRPVTKTYQKIRVPLAQAQAGMVKALSAQWLEDFIREDHGWKSFQHPDNIADAIRLISDVNLWKEVGQKMGHNASYIKTELKAIVERRNKIAHEADMDYTLIGRRWPITENDVTHVVDFISELGETIYTVV